MTKPLLTLDEAKKKFEAEGETVASWADAHGFPRDAVYAALSGRTRGKRGKAHQIAVALGIKHNPAQKEQTGTSPEL